MNHRIILFIIVSLCVSGGTHAQEIISPVKFRKFDKEPLKNSQLEEVNALPFKPEGYDTVVHPKLPDSLGGLTAFSDKEREERRKKQIELNPYKVFYGDISLKNGDIFVGFSSSWIRLSSYYQYNNDDISVEEYRKKVNQGLLGKTMFGYSPKFELLEDVKSTSRKLINADTVFIYDTKLTYRFKDTVDNYGSLLVHLVKFDLGYVTLKYYYPLDKREKALVEINNTWGLIRFRPDDEFTHPDHEGWTPRPEKPDLYFGKFSFLNNPEQERSEREQYEQRRLKGSANALAREAGRLLQAKDYDQTKAKLAEVLQIDSNNIIAYRYLLLTSIEENHRDDSRKYVTTLIGKDPKSADSWFLKGLAEKTYGELDSAANTFSLLLQEKDSLHFRSYMELAFISIMKGDHEAADLNFNRAMDIFKIEGEKSVRKERHRMLNINELLSVRLAYAQFLNGRGEFKKSKALFEQTLREDEEAMEAAKEGERQRIYGKLTQKNLGELHFMLAGSYARMYDEPNTKLHLEKARSLGKVLPEEMNHFLDQ